MMVTPLLPQTFWFRVALPCVRVEGIPRSRAGAKGRLLDLPPACALPDFAPLDGRTSWSKLRVAWNPRGLAVSVEASGRAAPITFGPDLPSATPVIELWIDTRDTRNVHRATRFCHRFRAALRPAASGSNLTVELVQQPIHRASGDAPLCRADDLLARAERLRQGWRVEMFFSSAALHGFDPDTNRRLGFAYLVTDPDREDQYLTVGREFPIGEDPSMWATLELKDSG
jgi:hypothetical protein